MFSTSGTTTGIDLGSKFVKLVRARGSVRPENLISAGVEAIETTGEETWSHDAGAALSRLLKKQHLGSRDLGRVITAVCGASVQLRHVDLPPLDEKELRASLKYEARKHLSLGSSGESALDCQVISRSADGPMNTLLVGAPEALVAAQVEVLKSVGIEPEVVDAGPLALLNGVLNQAEAGLDTVAVLDLGASGTTMILAKKRGVAYSRTVPVVADSPDVASSLARAFQETSQFFAPMNERRRIDGVFLSGGNAVQPGLAESLQRLLGIPVSVLDLTGRLQYSPSGSGGASKEELSRLAPQLAVALGLLYWGSNGV